MPVRQMRLVVTADDYDQALQFYRDVLGLPELGAFSAEGGHVAILDAGRATLELTDPRHAAYIDRVEVGDRSPGTSASRSRSTTPRRPRGCWSQPGHGSSPSRCGRRGTRSTPARRHRPDYS